MKKLVFFLIIILSATFSAFSQVKEVPFTLDDRDRIIRTEEQLNSLRNEMNARFEASDVKIESIRNEMKSGFEAVDKRFDFFYWAIGILISLMLFLLGYIIWDRRTALNPILAKTIILEDRVKKLENISKEQAKKDPAFAELLRAAGML
jgi:predicted PurR-regulated permease PerM